MLEAGDLEVFYGDLQALWGISLKVGEGEIVTLVGSNGAGKSTILKAISGLIRPAGGDILFFGASIAKQPPHALVELGICMVPEGKRLFPRMSVLENLEVGAYTNKARPAKDRTLERVYEVFPVLKARSTQLSLIHI